jgi:hypothetical protein
MEGRNEKRDTRGKYAEEVFLRERKKESLQHSTRRFSLGVMGEWRAGLCFCLDYFFF